MRLKSGVICVFDINLLDERMGTIGIDASNNKQLVMPIDRKFYEKRMVLIYLKIILENKDKKDVKYFY